MTALKLILACVVLACVLPAAGCKKDNQDQLDQMHAELENIRMLLAKTEREKEQITDDMTKIADNWEKAESEVKELTTTCQTLQRKVDQLTQQRDATAGKAGTNEQIIATMTNQLKKKTQQIKELEAVVAEQSATIQELDSAQPVEATTQPALEDANQQADILQDTNSP